MNKWLSTGYIKSKADGGVDRERGIISGALIATEGEAKGHGVFLDASFIDAVVAQGNSAKAGLKARFGHPNMCSTALGTFLGRWKNFRREAVTRDDGSAAIAARADLFLSTSAKDTPNGDLYDYMLNLSANEGDMFGTSIVFTNGPTYFVAKSGKKVSRRESGGYIGEDGLPHDETDDPVDIAREYATCERLHACDVVDDPAANDGLFSKFSNETLAGQITEFLDLHPNIWEAVESNPTILEALTKYSDQIEGFMNRYRSNRKPNKENEMSNEVDASVAASPAEVPAASEAQAVEVPEAVVAESAAVVVEEVKPKAEPELPPPVAVEAVPVEMAADPREDFKRMVADFGAELAAEVFAAGLGYAEAKERHFARLQDENKRLKEQMEALARAGGHPTAFASKEREGSVINGVHKLFREGTRAVRK